MFFKVHQKAKIGYKELSDADLGKSEGNQTHIGLFEDTLKFITNFQQQSYAQLIYKDKIKELVSFLDPIENKDGSFRSPKIRSGSDKELALYNESGQINSIVREIREIASSDKDIKWYIFWFGLENQDLVFLLLQKGGKEFIEIENLIGHINKNGIIGKDNSKFFTIIDYLNKKVNNLRIDYEKDLELVVQDEEYIKIKKNIKPFDIEKAKKLYSETGKRGEELVDKYLKNLVMDKKIKSYNWVNKEKESGYPYDFEIIDLSDNQFYTDVKSTAYNFEQRMIFSSQELQFIKSTSNFLIHRVYDINSTPRIKLCRNINDLAKLFFPKLENFNNEIKLLNLRLNTMKLEINPKNSNLSFEEEIYL